MYNSFFLIISSLLFFSFYPVKVTGYTSQYPTTLNMITHYHETHKTEAGIEAEAERSYKPHGLD